MVDFAKEVSIEFNTKIISDITKPMKSGTHKKKIAPKVKRKEKIHCDICGVVCNSLSSYGRHKLKHFKKLIFQCNECLKTFKSELQLICHIKTDHLGVLPTREKCPICNKLVLRMAIHILQHNDARFICEICGKRFVKHSIYTEHLVVHSDVKIHKCDICQMSFGRKGNLKVHLKSHEKYRDAHGNYLPMKPRGKAHSKYRKKVEMSPMDEILKSKWRIVEDNSKYCDTIGLETDAAMAVKLREDCDKEEVGVDAAMRGGCCDEKEEETEEVGVDAAMRGECCEEEKVEEEVDAAMMREGYDKEEEEVDAAMMRECCDEEEESGEDAAPMCGAQISDKWTNALYSSRSSDTADLPFYMDFLREIAD